MTNIEKQKHVEKRKHSRKKSSINVEYAAHLDTNQIAVIKNLSQEGAFIETQSQFEIGHNFLMQLYLPGQPKPLSVIGEVIWHNDSGMGIRFKIGFDTTVFESFFKSKLPSPF